MYYAQFNSFGSDTDVGFSNTWQVVSFGNKSARDAWVKMNADRRDIAAISRSEALKMAGAYQRLLHREGGHLAHIHYATDDNKTFHRAF